MTRADLSARYSKLTSTIVDEAVSDEEARRELDAFADLEVPTELEDVKLRCLYAAQDTMELRAPQHMAGSRG